MEIIKKIIKNISYMKILIPTLLTIIIFFISLFVIVIPQFEDIILDRKREMIRELTNSALSVIEKYHSMETAGTIESNEAKKSAIKIIKGLRYGDENKDYFWITDMHPNMIMHPYREDLDGKDLSDFEDSHKKKLFVMMAEEVKSKGEGYVDYMWQWKDDSLKIVSKLSYVKGFKPWGWIIGTGIYIEDVKLQISKLERNIITISIIITLLSSLLLTYIAYQNLRSERRRQKAEDELRQSREKYRMLVEASGEGLIMILENKQIYFNNALYSMLGFPEEETAPQPQEIFIKYPDSEIFDFDNLVLKKFDSASSEQFEVNLKKKSGEPVPVIITLSPINVMNNRGIVITVKDISRNKEIEEALDYTKEKYLALKNQLTLGVFRATPDKNFIFTEVNPALATILAANNENELLAKSLSDYFINFQESDSFLNEIFSQGYIKNRILNLNNSNGEGITVSISAVLVKNISGKPVSIDGIIEDISERQITIKEREQLISDLQISVLALNQNISPYINEIPSCFYDQNLSDAITKMNSTQSNAILIKTPDGNEIGILTDHDIRERALISAPDLNIPVYKIMTAPVSFITNSASMYDALYKFRENNARHLIVKNSDNVTIGILNLDKIFEASYSNYLFFLKSTSECVSAAELARQRKKLLMFVSGLIDNKTGVKGITKIISLLTDAITRRIIELAIKDLGEPPLNFAFIAMGSEGREEQTLSTDQDNAIVYEDINDENRGEAEKYFNALGERISNDLDAAGFQFCRGGIMAKNPKWCQPLTVWKKYFTDWITNAGPQELLDVKIFFDFRTIYGDKDLTDKMQSHINHLLTLSPNFFIYMSENLLRAGLPDNILKLKSSVDLKMLLLPVVDFIRIYGLKHNINNSNSLIRLQSLKDKGGISANMFEDLSFYYDFFTFQRLKHQLRCYVSGLNVNNEISQSDIAESFIAAAKKYFELLEKIKDKLSIDFRGTAIRQ